VVNHRDKHNPLTIETDLPHPTRLRLFVTGVSGHGGAHLIVERNGVRVLDKEMPDPDGYTKTDTLLQYNGEYTVDIPAGKQTVKVENIGNDWIFVSYVLERAVRQTTPPLRLFGLHGKKTSLLYIEHAQYTWHQVNVVKRPPSPVPPTVLHIADWTPGRYRVQFWDTEAGKPFSTQVVTVDKSGLRLELPGVERDIAVRMERW
jgi:hypothetical protein